MSDELERMPGPGEEEEKPTEGEETPAAEGGKTESPAAEEPEGEAGAAQQESATTAGAEEATVSPPATVDVTNNDRVWGLLAYFIPLLVPLFILLVEPNRYRPFQRYHAIHSLAFTAAVFVYEIALVIVFTIIAAIPLISCLLFCLWPLVFLPALLYLWYGVQAYQGRWITIPVLTDVIRQQGWIT